MTDYTYDQYVPGKEQAKKQCIWQQLTCDNKISHFGSTQNYTTLNSYLTLLITSSKILSDWPIPGSRILLDWLIIPQTVKTLSTFIELKGALSCPHNPTLILVMSQIQQSPHPPILFLEDTIQYYTAIYVGPLILITDMPSSNHALN